MRIRFVMMTWMVALVASGFSWTSAQSMATSTDVLKQARSYSLQAREGHYEVAPKAVALLEEATTADPTNVALWNALTTAYFLQATAAGQPGGNVMDALALFPRGMAASERALELDPNNPEALVNHGSTLTILALFQQKPELLPKGIAEMNRAVQLSPTMLQPRLVRAFFGVNLPPAVPDDQAIAEDLMFLARAAEGSRPGDMVHLLLGDLHAETGKTDEARRQYEAAARRPASAAREQAQARLAALARGGVPASDIAALRGGLATNCVMCHGRTAGN